MYFRYILKLHLAVTLILNCKDSNQTSCRTLQLIVMYNNTNSGCKRFNRSEGMSQSCSRLLNSVTLTLTVKINPIFSHDTPVLEYASHSQYQAWLQMVQCLLTSNGGKNEPPRWFQVCEFSTTTSRKTTTSVPSIYHFWTLLSQVRF